MLYYYKTCLVIASRTIIIRSNITAAACRLKYTAGFPKCRNEAETVFRLRKRADNATQRIKYNIKKYAYTIIGFYGDIPRSGHIVIILRLKYYYTNTITIYKSHYIRFRRYKTMILIILYYYTRGIRTYSNISYALVHRVQCIWRHVHNIIVK